MIIARIWGGFMVLCHLAGLAGAVVPLFLHTAYASGSNVATAFVSVAHHIGALVAVIAQESEQKTAHLLGLLLLNPVAGAVDEIESDHLGAGCRPHLLGCVATS